MKDLIYRQDAIDALEEVDWYHQNKDKDMVLGANPPEHQAWYKEDDIFKTLEALPSAQPSYTDEQIQKMQELEQAEIEKAFQLGKEDAQHEITVDGYADGFADGYKRGLIDAQPEWNNHTVACLLAELFDDNCACNFNGNDEWLPEKCEVIDACPNPVGVACWEQYLTHRAERRKE